MMHWAIHRVWAMPNSKYSCQISNTDMEMLPPPLYVRVCAKVFHQQGYQQGWMCCVLWRAV